MCLRKNEKSHTGYGTGMPHIADRQKKQRSGLHAQPRERKNITGAWTPCAKGHELCPGRTESAIKGGNSLQIGKELRE